VEDASHGELQGFVVGINGFGVVRAPRVGRRGWAAARSASGTSLMGSPTIANWKPSPWMRLRNIVAASFEAKERGTAPSDLALSITVDRRAK
jgi:hypothetical protein